MSYVQLNLDGATWFTLGDSITERGWYQTEVARILGIGAWENYGVGGTCVAKKDEDDDSAMCVRYDEMGHRPDVITIWGGINDFGFDFGSNGGVEIGDSRSESALTFTGALKLLLIGVSRKYPSARTGFIVTTPVSAARGMHRKNKKGYYLSDYCDVCRELCERYAIPYLDLQKLSGFNEATIDVMTSDLSGAATDGLHPSRMGMKRLAPKISHFILSI